MTMISTTMSDLAISPAQTEAPFGCVACGTGGSNGRLVMSAGVACPFDLFRCTCCGTVQQHPRYSAAEITRLYGSKYYVFEEDDSRRWARAVQQYVVHLAELERRGERRLLDVGCALGHFSALAKARGWHVTSLDVSADAASQAAVRFGLDVRAGPLSRHVDTLRRFDVVFLGDVIEHVPNPATFMSDVRRVLAPDGTVCIDTPNWGGFWRRWTGRRWIGLNKFHVNLFDAASLTKLLLATGYRDIVTSSYTHYRYEGWGARPELAAIVSRLPAALAWRVNRALSRLGRKSVFGSLNSSPPTNTDSSVQLVDTFATKDIQSRLGPGQSHDNLVVHAIKS